MVETGGLVYRSRSNMRVLSFCVYFCLVAAVFCGQKKNGKGGNGGDGGDGGNGGNGGGGGGGGCSIAYRTECYHGRRKRGLLQAALLNQALNQRNVVQVTTEAPRRQAPRCRNVPKQTCTSKPL